MKYRTLVKLACLALLLLPAIASADDNSIDVKPFGDVHVGTALVAHDSSDVNSGVLPLLDGEAGYRFAHLDLSAFGSYATKHVDEEAPDDIFDRVYMHYRLHMLAVGARVTFHRDHVYGGLGVANEWVIERGSDHVDPTSGTMKLPAYDRSHHAFDQHALFELRGGYTLASGIDMFGAATYAKTDYDNVYSLRVGVGYRF